MSAARFFLSDLTLACRKFCVFYFSAGILAQSLYASAFEGHAIHAVIVQGRQHALMPQLSTAL